MAILVVDDESESRTLLKSILTAEGFEVRAADCGDLALAAIAVQKPELILLDIRMPGKKGNELAHRMRQISSLQHIPIVLMTAFSLSDSDVFAMAQQDGVDYIIYKPLPAPDELRQMIDKVIENKKASKGQSV